MSVADDAPPLATVEIRDAALATRSDRVIVEAPLEIRLGGKPTTVLMRTPGHDVELVRGFLYGEDQIPDLAAILSIERPAGLTGDELGNVLDVTLAPMAVRALPERLFYSSSSCGVCGKRSIAQLVVRAGATRPVRFATSAAVLQALPERLRAAQPLFGATGGVHAAALFEETGELVAVREDVGRHNAVDKLVGWALGAGRLPLGQLGLIVSGRVSYEILQKAIAAGLPLVAAVGAPSSLAIDLAEQFDVTLAGFLRPFGLNIYAGGSRITP